MELWTVITGLRFQIEKLRKKQIGRIYFTITHTEQRVAELLYNGLTYQAIADELVVSYHTIKKHVQNIYVKCGVNSRYELHKWLENQKN